MLEGPDVLDELRQVLIFRGLVRRRGDGGLRQSLGGGVPALFGVLEDPVRRSFLGKQAGGRDAEVLLHHNAIRVLWRTGGERLRPSVAHERGTRIQPTADVLVHGKFLQGAGSPPSWLRTVATLEPAAASARSRIPTSF